MTLLRRVGAWQVGKHKDDPLGIWHCKAVYWVSVIT